MAGRMELAELPWLLAPYLHFPEIFLIGSQEAFQSKVPKAHETLLLDMILEDATLFMHKEASSL
jgi:hypothetical protein